MSAEGIAAVFAVAVGLATLMLGVHTYRQSARSTRLAHMHKLFGDYLGHEFNLKLARGAGNSVDDAERSLCAFKMYTLEEMWLWLENEKRQRPWPHRSMARRVHDRLVTGWENTILYHIRQGTELELVGFMEAHQCYTPGFVKLVCRHHPCSPGQRPPALPAADPG